MVILDVKALRREFDKVSEKLKSKRFHMRDPVFYAMGFVDEKGIGHLKDAPWLAGEVVVHRKKGLSVISFRYLDLKESFNGSETDGVRDCEPLGGVQVERDMP